MNSLKKPFYSGFEYTFGNKAWCHPVTLSILADILKSNFLSHLIGIDVRLDSRKEKPDQGWKFRPDIVVFDTDYAPQYIIDFESPNSSDYRVVTRDMDNYFYWAEGEYGSGEDQIKNWPPYLIVTSLPNSKVEKWKLRYKKGYNILLTSQDYEEEEKALNANPFIFWSTKWMALLKTNKWQKPQYETIRILNIAQEKDHSLCVMDVPIKLPGDKS